MLVVYLYVAGDSNNVLFISVLSNPRRKYVRVQSYLFLITVYLLNNDLFTIFMIVCFSDVLQAWPNPLFTNVARLKPF